MSAAPLIDKSVSVISTNDILQNSSLLLDVVGENVTDHDYSLTVDKLTISDFSLNVVTYIAGYVARQLCKKLHCVACSSALMSKDKVAENCKLLSRKDAGGLLFPSHSLITVCSVTERCIRFLLGLLCDRSNVVPHQRNLKLVLQMAVIERTQHLHLFNDSVDEHNCSLDILDSHALNLIRLVVNCYVNIRFYHMGKLFSEQLRGKNVRFNSNKLVLFAHQ
jgi:hypothetical protein